MYIIVSGSKGMVGAAFTYPRENMLSTRLVYWEKPEFDTLYFDFVSAVITDLFVIFLNQKHLVLVYLPALISGGEMP